jgi:hypothetical protein
MDSGSCFSPSLKAGFRRGRGQDKINLFKSCPEFIVIVCLALAARHNRPHNILNSKHKVPIRNRRLTSRAKAQGPGLDIHFRKLLGTGSKTISDSVKTSQIGAGLKGQ